MGFLADDFTTQKIIVMKITTPPLHDPEFESWCNGFGAGVVDFSSAGGVDVSFGGVDVSFAGSESFATGGNGGSTKS